MAKEKWSSPIMASTDVVENNVNINHNDELIPVSDSVKSIGVKIEAARSGRVNGNLVFYTPKAMTQGMESFLTPFNKHLQSKHNGKAVGVIREAEHVSEMFPEASQEFIDIANRVKEHSEARNGKELVKAVKELIQTEEYKSPSYRGLGIATIYGDIYDPSTIGKIRNNDIGTVSIGGGSKEVYCSICSERYTHDHPHKKGQVYNDELCFHINNDLYLDHCGFVANPADKLTGTEVVKDSQDEFLNVGITHYKVQDSTEKSMTLEELKQKAKDPASVKELIHNYFTDKTMAEEAFKHYEANLKNSRANHHLLSEGNVLNLRTPVGIYVAEKLLEEFDETDEDKSYLTEVLVKAKKTLGIDNLDKALQDFLDSKKEKAPDEETKKTDDAKEEKKADEPTTTEAVVKDSQEETPSLEKVLKSYMDEKFATLTDLLTTKVEDSVQEGKTALHKELDILRTHAESDEAVIKSLQADLSNSLIDQITTLKGGVSEEYRAKLSARSIDQLKLTLEDLKESNAQKAESKEIDTTLQKTSTTEVMTQVADSQQDIPGAVEEPTTEQPTDEAAPAEATPATTEEETKVEDSLSPEQLFQKRVEEIGFSAALKEAKNKKVKR